MNTYIEKFEEDAQKKIAQWDKDFERTEKEVLDLVSNLHVLDGTDVFQSLSLSFFSIHMCNYFVFSIRKILLSSVEHPYHIVGLFYNSSNIPAPNIMKQYIYIIFNKLNLKDNSLYMDIIDNYSQLYALRNKFAHADTDDKDVKDLKNNITTDMFKDYFNHITDLLKISIK